MAKRTHPRYAVPTVEQPAAITPDSGLRITLKQAAVAIVVIAGAGGAYFTIKSDVAEIRKVQETFTAQTPAALKDQDEKRTRLGEAFLASNKLIADKVGELATAVAVQRADASATKEALVRISDQLNVLVRQMPATAPARGR